MTDLNKPVTRRSHVTVRSQGKNRQIVVMLHPNGTVKLRLLGTRRTEEVTLDAVYSLAVKQRVAMEKRVKREAKKK